MEGAVSPRPVAQPFLHELATCVRAPSTLLSGRDGQMRPGGFQGWLRHDVRQLSQLVVALTRPGDPQRRVEPDDIGSSLDAAWSARFVGVSRLHRRALHPLPDYAVQDGDAVDLTWRVDLAARTSWHLELVATGQGAEDGAPG